MKFKGDKSYIYVNILKKYGTGMFVDLTMFYLCTARNYASLSNMLFLHKDFTALRQFNNFLQPSEQNL